MNLPKDPMILLSYINTKLRDEYTDLDILCRELEVRRSELEKIFAEIGYQYDKTLNRFF